MKRLGCLVLGTIIVARASVAAADPVPPERAVVLEKSACEATSVGEVASILRVELRDRLLLLEGQPQGDAYRAAIDCSGAGVEASVSVPGGTRMSFQTNLTRAPANVRARIVALAIAELVRDLDREVDEPRPPILTQQPPPYPCLRSRVTAIGRPRARRRIVPSSSAPSRRRAASTSTARGSSVAGCASTTSTNGCAWGSTLRS